MEISGFEIISEKKSRTLEGRIFNNRLSNQYFSLTIFSIVLIVAELLSVYAPVWGVALHTILLLFVLFYSAIMTRISPSSSKLFATLIPVPLIRIVSIASPLLLFTMVEWFLVISIMLFSSILLCLRITGLPLKEYGFRMPERRFYPLEFFIILLGLAFGFMEFNILNPTPISSELTILGIFPPLLGLYFSTGLLEELLFRGLIQRHSTECLGTIYGIAFTTFVFMIMHTGWQSVADIFFVGAVGAVYSVVVHRTGSIVGVSFSHAMVNISLFVIAPTMLT